MSLEHIEPVHELVRLDWIADALFQMGVTEGAPFGGKLGVLLEQGHEIACESGFPSGGLGAENPLGRQVHQPQADLPAGLRVDKDVVQYLRIGVDTARNTAAVLFLSQTQGFFIIFQCHKCSLLRSFEGSAPRPRHL